MEPSAEIAEIINGWFIAAVAGDVTWRDQHVSGALGLRIVGTDPEEWLSGTAAYTFLRDEAETVGGKATVEVRDVEAFSEGTVGWGVARPVITLGNGKQVSPRWTAVFHREDQDWLLVQLHASIGITNEQAFSDLFQQRAS